MRRPRIALWIKWHCRMQSRFVVRVDGNMPSWPVPQWLWRWAVRRVDRYREEQDRIALAYIRAVTPKIREGFAKLARLRKELGG